MLECGEGELVGGTRPPVTRFRILSGERGSQRRTIPARAELTERLAPDAVDRRTSADGPLACGPVRVARLLIDPRD